MLGLAPTDGRHPNIGQLSIHLKSLAFNAGADPNACAADGSSPLHWAALVGSEDAVRVLLVGVAATTVFNDSRLSELAVLQLQRVHNH